jgi:hypothetical protein
MLHLSDASNESGNYLNKTVYSIARNLLNSQNLQLNHNLLMNLNFKNALNNAL